MSVPVCSGGWWYVTRTIEGSSYPIHCRGPTADEATSEVLLDENVEADGHDFFDVGAFDLVARPHAAWHGRATSTATSTTRCTSATWRPVSDRVDHIVDVCNAGTAWSRDGALPVLRDRRRAGAALPGVAARGRRGAAGAVDTLVFEEADERFFVGIGETRRTTS